MTHKTFQFLLTIASAAALEGKDAGTDQLSVQWTKNSTAEGRGSGSSSAARFSPVIGFRITPGSSLTELHDLADRTSPATAEPTLGMACSDAMVNTATVASSSCAQFNGVCTNGPLESVMDGQVDHAWRPNSSSDREYLEYTWPNPVMIRFIQTSGLAEDATVSPPCGSPSCGAPGNYRVQYQDATGTWRYYISFTDANQAYSYSTLDGAARPPATKMQSLTPPVESNKIRLRFVSFSGDTVAARASIRGCLASATAAGDMTLNTPYLDIFPAVFADVRTFANTLKGLIEHESTIFCSADQIAVQSVAPSTGATMMSGSTTVRVMFLPKGTMNANEQPTNCVQALGSVISNSQSELAQWAANVLSHSHPVTVPTCADVNCGTHGNCAAGRCFCNAGWQGSNCDIDMGAGNANRALVTEGDTAQGLGDAAPVLLPVTQNALTFQYNVGGTPPTDDEMNAEMDQVAEDLRLDNQFDESGWSGRYLRHGKLLLGGYVATGVLYIIMVAMITKTNAGKKDSIKDIDGLPRASMKTQEKAGLNQSAEPKAET